MCSHAVDVPHFLLHRCNAHLQLKSCSVLLRASSYGLCLQAWLAANHSVEDTQAEMARLQALADAVMHIAEPKVTFRLIQVRQYAALMRASTCFTPTNLLQTILIYCMFPAHASPSSIFCLADNKRKLLSTIFVLCPETTPFCTCGMMASICLPCLHTALDQHQHWHVVPLAWQSCWFCSLPGYSLRASSALLSRERQMESLQFRCCGVHGHNTTGSAEEMDAAWEPKNVLYCCCNNK